MTKNGKKKVIIAQWKFVGDVPQRQLAMKGCEFVVEQNDLLNGNWQSLADGVRPYGEIARVIDQLKSIAIYFDERKKQR